MSILAARSSTATSRLDFQHRLGVVIPLASEQETVERFLADVLSHLGETDVVFCVLDRACRDRTRELLTASQPSAMPG